MTELTINEIVVPCEMNMLAVREYAKSQGIEKINDIQKIIAFDDSDPKFDDLEKVSGLVFFGIKEGCRQKKISVPVELEDVFLWIFKNGGQLGEVFKDLSASMTGKEPGENKPKSKK